MAVRIGSIDIDKLTQVSVRERARLSRYSVPGFKGDFIQTFGRPSVEVSLSGIFYGAKAFDDLAQLRALHLENKPVDFFADAIGEGYFTQVLISRLDLMQRAGEPEQFNFICEVVEYVEPPEPALTETGLGLDAGLLDEAGAFMDDVQNSLAEVSQLVDLVSNFPSFGNPVGRLAEMPAEYGEDVGGALNTLSTLRDLF
jgi:hypothetical protein